MADRPGRMFGEGIPHFSIMEQLEFHMIPTNKRLFYDYGLCYIAWTIFFYILIDFYMLERGAAVGVIIGTLFPGIYFLYLYDNYVKHGKYDSKSLRSWILPSVFLHIIVIFGFMFTLSTKDFKRIMYTSSYEYGRLFESFNAEENKILLFPKHYFKDDGDKHDEFMLLYSYYSSHFKEPGSYKSEKRPKDKNGTGPVEAIERSRKFAELSARIKEIPFRIAFTFGFLGALIFGLRNAVYRANNRDLYPKTYIFYIIRFIVSGSLAVALASLVLDSFPLILAPVLFFAIGYFPERAIVYIDAQMSRHLRVETARQDETSLNSIQGITPDKALRLQEIGIQDIQNMAVADTDELSAKLPYPKAMLDDWKAQGILLLQLPNKVTALRDLGIRTIMDLKKYASHPEDIAGELAMKPSQIKNVIDTDLKL